MSLLKEVIIKMKTGGKISVLNEFDAMLASEAGKVFKGLYLEDVEFLLNCVAVEDLENNTEEQIVEFLAQQRAYFFESLAMQIIALTTRSEKVTLTDSEFQTIKDKAPSLVGERNKKQLLEFINQFPNEFAAEVLQKVDRNIRLPVREISNPLYAFFHELASTAKFENGRLDLNQELLADSDRIAEILHGLKTKQRTGNLKPLGRKATAKNFFDVTTALFATKKLVRSLFPNSLAMEFSGRLKDYSEAEFEEHFIGTASLLLYVMNSISDSNSSERRDGMVKDSSNPLYKYVHLLVSKSTFCSHGGFFPNDEIISDYDLINVVLKDLKEKTRTTKEGRELPKLNGSIDELQFVRVLKKVCHTQAIRCSADKLVYHTNGVKKDLGELTLINHIVTELNKLEIESPQYPPSAHTSSTSLSSSSSASTTTTANIPPAVASVVLSSPDNGISRI